VGAAIQGGVLAGEVRDILLLDVTPLSLGVETLGGITNVMIPRNTTIPTRRTETYTTASDFQPEVEIHVLQGERKMASDNRTLGKFKLIGLPPAPRGVPQIEVTFDIDANGILHVTAKDKATNKEQKIRIEAASGLSKEEAERMRQDAEAHAEEDRKRAEEVEVRTLCDSRVYQVERMLKENRDKLPEADGKAVEAAIEDCRKAMAEGSVERIKSANAALEQAAHRVAEHLYRASAAAGGTQGAAGGPSANGASQPGGESSPPQGDVIDAEYVDVDESKRPN
jgi:molecular chaperone DnaK